MNECRRFQDLIEEYLDGTIDESRLEELKTHAAVCEACAGEFARSVQMREVIADAFEPQTAAKDAAALIVAKSPNRRQPARIRLFFGRPALAAAILLAAGAILGFVLGRSDSVGPDETAALALVPMQVAGLEGTVLVCHEGSDVWRPLKQGAAVHLGDAFHCMSKSNLTLEVGDKSTVQIVENSMLTLVSYDGETRFHLEHGHCRASLQSPHGPFFISTPHGRVEALGTEFTVTVE